MGGRLREQIQIRCRAVWVMNMYLRKLEEKDAPFMLEWMHAPVVTKNLRSNFAIMTMQDCIEFIDAAGCLEKDIHMAVADEADTYMGTVSLKHIADGFAEFAIVMRESAMGMGFSKYAMHEIIRKGFEEMNLERIYWCVDKKNKRACRFYDKNGYKKVTLDNRELFRKILKDGYTLEEMEKYLWYSVERMEHKRMRNILFVKGLSQYNAMRKYIEEIEMGFRLAGFHTITLDTRERSFRMQLEEVKRSMQIDFVFTCNAIEYNNLKLENAVYITYLCDHPATHCDRLRSLGDKAIVFTCDRLHEEYIKKYYRNIKYVKYIPLSGSYTKKNMEFGNRKYDIVFMGSYRKPEDVYATAMSAMTGPWQTLTECIKDIVENPEETVEGWFLNAVKKFDVSVSDEDVEELMPYFVPVNDYARFYFRDRIIRTLVENGIRVHVFGNGWDEFESDFKQNLMIEDGNYYIAQKAVANAKISLNVMPWFKEGFQERIATAMLSGTIALTDESIYINDNFENGRELVTFSLNQLEELPEKVNKLLANEELAEQIANAGRERAMRELTWQHRAIEMIDFICSSTEWLKNMTTGTFGEILQITYPEEKLRDRLLGLDVIDNIDEIMEMLGQLEEYDKIDSCDLKYLYEKYLFLYLRIRQNFPEISTSMFTYNYLMNLKEENLESGIELFIMECRSLQNMFLKADYAEVKKQLLEMSNSGKDRTAELHEQKVLVKKIVQNYAKSDDERVKEILQNIQGRQCVTAYNQNFVAKYSKTIDELVEEVWYDETAEMHYVNWNGKKMYYPKGHSKRYVASEINFVKLEQDLESPHRYLTDSFNVHEGDIVIDAGVAEGNFALDIVEKAKKIYLVECEHEWIDALKKTFEPWQDKVVIIEKMLGGINDEEHATIDTFVQEDEVNFIKMDVEGAEVSSLKGASRVLNNSKNIRCAICSYHRKNAEKDIRKILEDKGFYTSTTPGYMFFKEDMDSWVDGELRRGLVKAEKTNVFGG